MARERRRKQADEPVVKERWLIEGKPASLRCMTCGAWIPLYCSAKGKPWGFCHECGFHVFFRMSASWTALEAFVASGNDVVRLEEGDGVTEGTPEGADTLERPTGQSTK